MTTKIDRPLLGFRFVETHYGDSLQSIAARELGDASRWPELVSFNRLVPPFITDDPVLATDGVILTGSAIRVPAPKPVASSITDPDSAFLTDAQLSSGQLDADASGDLQLCSGLANLRQALAHRVVTARGELLYHGRYGSLIKRLIGTVNGPTASILAAQYAKSAVETDPRIKEVSSATAEVVGDAINVSVEAVAISGRAVSINEVI